MSFVDLRFHVQGNVIPVDHGYLLLSAISGVVPELHGDKDVGIHAISGRLLGDRTLALSDKSNLTVRIQADRVGQALRLAGQNLKLGEHSITVGVPNTRALVPSARLYSRLVVIKGFMEPEAFLEAARRQLNDMEIKADVSLVSTEAFAEVNQNRAGGTKSPWLRRTLKIRDKNIVGFAVQVNGLTDEESILLQERGLGGRRRFGCGIFIPAK